MRPTPSMLRMLLAAGAAVIAGGVPGGRCARPAPAARAQLAATGGPRAGLVRLQGHSLVDDGGPFLGLGASYFTALWRARHDRPRLEADLAFLSRHGFNYFRMLSMVGWNAAW